MFTTVVSLANGPESTFSKKTLEVEKNLVSVKLDPVFKRKGNKLLVNLLNLKEEKVILQVIDSEGRMVYSENINDKVIVEKAFDFSKAYGEYTVVVVDYYGTYKETIAIR